MSVLIAEDPDDAANDPDHAHDAKWQLQIAIEALPDGFVLYDAEDRLVICNERYRELYPESAAAMVPGATFEEILKYGLANGQYAAGLGREDEWLQERLTAHRSADRCIEQELGNGRWLRILEQKVPGGGRVGLRIDITEQIHSRERAEIAERRLLDAIDALPAGFWLFDSDDRLVLINERYKELFKLSADALRPGNTYEDVLRYGLKNRQYPAAEGREEEWLATVLDTHRTGGYELEYELADGTWIRSYNQFTSDGGQVGFRVDITELKMQQEELRLAALTDDLTGLRNRRALSTRLEDIANELADGERLAFLHIDLDKFKSINDTLGHDAGDHVLRQTAQKLISGGESFEVAARVGGDEFLLAKKTCDDDQAVIRLGAALVRTICKPVPYRGKLCHVGASVGIAFVTPDRTASIEEIIGDADIALNAAKSAGRSTCRIFTQDMRAVAVQSAVVSAQIQEGLTRHEFQPFLQPQVDIQTLRIIGFEALARWHHPARGVLSATKFIQVAQDSRLIEEIDNQIFAEVCQTISRLHELGMPDPRVSVNVSTAQLSDPMLVDRLIWTADAAEINPACIGIEILESTMLDDRSAHVIENIHRLADEGFPIELDDFGTGHAAIANLRRFPVERIKIDRSFVSGIDQDAELQLITGAIVGLARKLGLRVLAEGIETQAELDFLEEVRCTCAQGFLFARPMAFDDLLSWIETWPHGFGAAPPGTAVA
ncbi:MAG: EAL domain-containing protein [Rhodobacter sp.]|nr:EAL domain-containing protein [Rhodobacter sp.]